MVHLRQLDFPEHTVSVQIDERKCLGPLDCGACAQNCPARVFVAYAKKRVRREAPTDWGIVAANEIYCWGCEICLKVCPENAITIREVTKSP